MQNRRTFLAAAGAAVAGAAASRAAAQWQPSQRYPDPAVRVLDDRFAGYRLTLAKVSTPGACVLCAGGSAAADAAADE